MFGIAQLRTMIGEIIGGITELSASSIRPQEVLSVTVQAAVKVYCAHCSRHACYLRSESGGVSVENLAPLPGGRTPINFNCPHCGQDLRAYAPEPKLKTDKGYWNKGG